MGIGVGVLLLVVGAILYWAVDVNIPGVSDNTLGIILMVVGVIAIILSFMQTGMLTRGRRSTYVERRDDVPPGY
ncbi:MAG: DUF6458 family protein [Marmoricola sp.]